MKKSIIILLLAVTAAAQEFKHNGENFEFSIQTQEGKDYRALYSPNCIAGSWYPASGWRTGNGQAKTLPVLDTGNKGFYRFEIREHASDALNNWDNIISPDAEEIGELPFVVQIIYYENQTGTVTVAVTNEEGATTTHTLNGGAAVPVSARSSVAITTSGFTGYGDPDFWIEAPRPKNTWIFQNNRWHGYVQGLYALESGKVALIAPVRVTVTKTGTIQPQNKPLCIVAGEQVTAKVEVAGYPGLEFWDGPDWWYRKQLDGRGDSDTSWSYWYPLPSSGTSVDWTPPSGIYQIRATMFNGIDEFSTVLYAHTTHPYRIPGTNKILDIAAKKGSLRSFGVCSTAAQKATVDSAELWMGSTAYAPDVDIPAQYGFSLFRSASTCNIFVAHRACAGGQTVPVMHGTWPYSAWPPVALDWYSNPVTGWSFIGPPEPGMIVSWSLGSTGHTAIMSASGQGIGSGVSGTVNKNYLCQWKLHGTSIFRKYNQ